MRSAWGFPQGRNVEELIEYEINLYPYRSVRTESDITYVPWTHYSDNVSLYTDLDRAIDERDARLLAEQEALGSGGDVTWHSARALVNMPFYLLSKVLLGSLAPVQGKLIEMMPLDENHPEYAQ